MRSEADARNDSIQCEESPGVSQEKDLAALKDHMQGLRHKIRPCIRFQALVHNDYNGISQPRHIQERQC